MTTTIEITCGGRVKVQQIVHPICRIGSNANLELCMPGIDGHAATLRVQNGKRFIYNRSTKALSLNGKRILPEQTMEWSGNQILDLAEGVRLRLLNAKTANDTTAERASELNGSPNQSTETTSPASSAKQRKLTIVGFFLVFATLLFSADSGSGTRLRDEEFAELVHQLTRAEAASTSGRYQQMRVDLQNAILRADLRTQSLQNLKQVLAANSSLSADLPTTEASPEIDARLRAFINKYF